jgi:hypothetical protein
MNVGELPMGKRALLATLLCGLLGCVSANAQIQTITNQCPYSHHLNDLACLIPDLTHTGNSSNLSSFNTTLAQVIGQLPLAVPVSGFALSFDRSLGIYVVSSAENLGSVLTERGDTIGRHKLFLGFTYQRFVFQSIDGTDLHRLPAVFEQGTGLFGSTNTSVGVNINQYTAVAAFGLTSRIDISMTLPFERLGLSAAHDLILEATSGGALPTPRNAQIVAGSASGIGDLLLNAKGTVWKGEKFRLALGTEFRIPTGDEYNLLGSGAYGLKPYIVFSRRGRITPHVNVGYQWNNFSSLYVNPCFTKPLGSPLSCQSKNSSNPNYSLPTLRLPSDLDYSGGVDIGIVKRLTFVADLVGQHYFNAPRVTPAKPAPSSVPTALIGKPTVGIANGDYDSDSLGLGFKVNPVGHLLISANVLIRLNTGGLRADYVPLVGVSYKF